MCDSPPLTCLKDPPRKGEKLTLSSSGTLVATTDSLGRILLIDTQALVVVRLFKVSQLHTLFGGNLIVNHACDCFSPGIP